MNTELVFLGTGNAMSVKYYNTCFLVGRSGEYLLVDAGGGNGIFRQMEAAGVGFASLRNMFITHAHTDHILGTVWVVRKIATMMNAGRYEGKFDIYCHADAAAVLKFMCSSMLTSGMNARIGDRIMIREVTDRETVSVMGCTVTFFDIMSSKMKQFGFRMVLPEGISVVCLGDEPFNPGCSDMVSGCDWLLSEAFCLYGDRDVFRPYEKHHSTALDAGRLAAELGVNNLVLYHTEDATYGTRKKLYAAEAASVFGGNVYVPDDLERIELV